MKKLVVTLILIYFYFSLAVKTQATTVADKSAVLIKNLSTDSNIRQIKKKIVISKILAKYNSPLADSTDTFVSTCFTYDFNCYLLPSIAGLESGFGNYISPNSFNPFGWGGGYIIFNSWDEAIDNVGRGLKVNYIDKGATTVEQIAPIYAESLTWAPRINYYISIFQKEEKNIDSILEQNAVNL